MSYEDKMAAARTAIEQHNDAIGEDFQINPDNFLTKIKIAGGTSEARLKTFAHEQMLEFMPEFDGVKPTALVKQIAQIFRGKQQEEEERKYVSSRKAERMNLRELVEHFDPQDTDSSVAKRLKEIAKEQPFIVFLDGLTIDVENTVMILSEVKKGYGGRKDIDVDGETKEVYPIGVLPATFDLVDEDPLYPNRPLRPDGTSDQTGRSWEGVPLNVRQLIRLALEVGNIKNLDASGVWVIHDMALDADGFTRMKKMYRKAALRFKELESTGDLPKLKIKIGGSCRPFANGSKVQFTKPISGKVVEADFDVPRSGNWSDNIYRPWDVNRPAYICKKGGWYYYDYGTRHRPNRDI